MSSEMDVESAAEPVVAAGKPLTIQDISRVVGLIVRGVETVQPRVLQRAIRQNLAVRRGLDRSLLLEAIAKFVPVMNPSYDALVAFSQALPQAAAASLGPTAAPETLPSALLPEVEVYLFTILITTLSRFKLDEAASLAAGQLVDRIRGFNRRTLDQFAAKAFVYYSLCHEKLNSLESIRGSLLALYRTACIHHDEMSQAVLLNLILRNYLHYNLVTQAHTFSLRTSFPENVSNNQFCRYLYYMGRIQAVQLEYGEANQRLLVAQRKAPAVSSGFNAAVTKLMVLVSLLMGEIPERSVFNHRELRLQLVPYLALTQAVRLGDLNLFNATVAKHSAHFAADKNLTLVHRLGHNVLKSGLRKISLSYSRIALADVAAKLHLASASSAEYICAKAIRDGVIEASIDHEHGWLLSNDSLDIYSTEEPQKAFHKRIAFCLDVHNEAVKAMRYPPDAYKKLSSASKGDPSKDEKSIEELIKELEEEGDE